MAQYLDNMRHYIRLTETRTLEADPEDQLLDEIISELDLDDRTPLLEELNDVIFKLQSYQEVSGSPEYAQGVEEGLALAATMLERLIERYSSSK